MILSHGSAFSVPSAVPLCGTGIVVSGPAVAGLYPSADGHAAGL